MVNAEEGDIKAVLPRNVDSWNPGTGMCSRLLVRGG